MGIQEWTMKKRQVYVNSRENFIMVPQPVGKNMKNSIQCASR
jgi:hypothetical protein